MANVIWLQGNQHRQTQSVLPWYVTGRLDAAERAMVEDHLADCEVCRADVQAEREAAALIRNLPFNIGANCGETIRRVPAQRPPRSRSSFRQRAGRTIGQLLARPGKLGWLATGQLLVIGLIAVLAMPRVVPADYHTLGAQSVRAPGNVIVIFRPDTREQEFRSMLIDSRARLVDGPTASGAYVLQVSDAERDAIVAGLKMRKSIVLAQPIDAGPSQ